MCGCGHRRALPRHPGPLGHCWVPPPCRRTRREYECPNYEMDPRGKLVRCHFNDVSRLPKHLQILVRGTSQGARIPCSDRTVELSEIGEYRSRTHTALGLHPGLWDAGVGSQGTVRKEPQAVS